MTGPNQVPFKSGASGARDHSWHFEHHTLPMISCHTWTRPSSPISTNVFDSGCLAWWAYVARPQCRHSQMG